MRPRLHPEMGRIVICARVARQLAGIYHRCGGDYMLTPATAASRAAGCLPLDGYDMLKFALHSLSIYLGLGWPSVKWLECVLEQAHYGASFRRCFFFDYKADRSPYPRVTNRGVQVSSEAASARKKGSNRNA